MITAIHRVGDDACGGIAFWYDEIGARQDMMEADRVTMPNNVEKPSTGSIMICGSCGVSISPAELDFLPGEFEEYSWAAKSLKSDAQSAKWKNVRNVLIKIKVKAMDCIRTVKNVVGQQKVNIILIIKKKLMLIRKCVMFLTERKY